MKILEIRKKRRNDPELLPREQPIITSIAFEKEGRVYYLYGDQMIDFITLYVSDTDIFQELLGEYSMDSPFFLYLEDHLFNAFEGVVLEEELELLSNALQKIKNPEVVKLIRFLLYVSNTESSYDSYCNKDIIELEF